MLSYGTSKINPPPLGSSRPRRPRRPRRLRSRHEWSDTIAYAHLPTVFEAFAATGRFAEGISNGDHVTKLRAQIRRIFYNLVGRPSNNNWAHASIGDALLTEYPHRFSSGMNDYDVPEVIFKVDKIEDMFYLDLIEMAVKVSSACQRSTDNKLMPPRGQGHLIPLSYSLEDDLNDLNYRFRECGYGYQLENTELVPIDSTYTHAEAVEPTLTLLKAVGFEVALEEFYVAFEDYKRGDYRDSIKKCGDALESTMKTIFSNFSWTAPNSGNFSPYIREAIKNGLLLPHLETHYNHLAGLIISGPGTFRNNEGGHGRGPEEEEAPDYFSRYMINMTASSILFIIHAFQSKPTEDQK